MQMPQLDSREVVRKAIEGCAPGHSRLTRGMPLSIMRLVEPLPWAASRASIKILVDARVDRVHLSDERMQRFHGFDGNNRRLRVSLREAKDEARMVATSKG
jgi:hypothetical protein